MKGARIYLELPELRMLNRIFSSGIIGGDADVRSEIQGKISRAIAAIVNQEAETIDGEVVRNETNRLSPYLILGNDGRPRRAESYSPESVDEEASAPLHEKSDRAFDVC